MDAAKLSQIQSRVQSQTWDTLKSDTQSALAPKGSFAQRVVNLFSSNASIEGRNTRIAADLLHTLTQQVGSQIAGKTVSTLLENRNASIINRAQVREAIAEASIAYAKAVEAFSESPLSRDYMPEGTHCPKPMLLSSQDRYVSILINQCLARSFDMGISPAEMIKHIANPGVGGHPEHHSAIAQMASDTLPHIAAHAAGACTGKFQLTQTGATYKEIGQACLKGLPWLGKPEEEAAKMYVKNMKKGPMEEFHFGPIVMKGFNDPLYIGVENTGLNNKLAAMGLDVKAQDASANNKLHISIHPDDRDKAFQVMLPLLLSKDMPFDQLKFTNYENPQPGKKAFLAKQQVLLETGATPEIRARAADAIRMAHRVHIGNQVTFYCPTYSDEKTRATCLKMGKDFMQTLEKELQAAGVRPGEKSEGHDLPGMAYSTFRWEENPRVPVSRLNKDQMALAHASDVYQSFH